MSWKENNHGELIGGNKSTGCIIKNVYDYILRINGWMGNNNPHFSTDKLVSIFFKME